MTVKIVNYTEDTHVFGCVNDAILWYEPWLV